MKLLSRLRTFLVASLLVTTAACGDAAKDYYAKDVAEAKKGDLDHALSDLDKAIELNPHHAAAYFARGFARQSKKDSKAAGSLVELKFTSRSIGVAGRSPRFALSRCLAPIGPELTVAARNWLPQSRRSTFTATSWQPIFPLVSFVGPTAWPESAVANTERFGTRRVLEPDPIRPPQSSPFLGLPGVE
jgi:hypothetical protein